MPCTYLWTASLSRAAAAAAASSFRMTSSAASGDAAALLSRGVMTEKWPGVGRFRADRTTSLLPLLPTELLLLREMLLLFCCCHRF